MLERVLEKKLVEYARKKGVLTYKFSSPSNAGVPDRIFIGNGVVQFLELKQKGKKPTALQMREIQRLKDHGALAGWCDDLAFGKSLIDVLALHDAL